MKILKFVTLGVIVLAHAPLVLAMNHYSQIEEQVNGYVKERSNFLREALSSYFINDLTDPILGYEIATRDIRRETENLFDAIRVNNYENALFAIENGAFVNYIHSNDGYSKKSFTILVVEMITRLTNREIALSKGLPILKSLIVNGADLNFRNHHGNTVLMEAIKMCDYDVVKFLVEEGADIEIKNTLHEYTAYDYVKNLLKECFEELNEDLFEKYIRIISLLWPYELGQKRARTRRIRIDR